MKITFNLWDNIRGDLNFDKNDLTEGSTTVKMADKLKKLYVESAGTIYKGNNIRNIIYTWISNAEELNSLQRVAENLNDGRDALSYNYILKNDIDASGLVDADGNLIDWDGNRIDENGYLLDANGDHILDEEGNYKMSTNLVSASGRTDADSSGDAVSNPDAPAPLEDDEAETTEDNDEETDGITNEEAGLE